MNTGKKITVSSIILMMVCSLLVGCITTSSGKVVLGAEGSPAWHKFAPPEDVKKYWRSKSMLALRMAWDKSYDSIRVREAIAAELEHRGKNPLMFFDSKADAEMRQRDEISRIRREVDEANDKANKALMESERLKWDKIIKGSN